MSRISLDLILERNFMLTSISPPGKPQDTMDCKQQQESPTDGNEGSGSGRCSDSKGENDGRGMRESSSSVGGACSSH